MWNQHFPICFSQKLIKTHHGFWGHATLESHLKLFFFLSCPPCNSIGIEHWHHLEDKLLSQQRCPVDHRWWENARNPERRIDLPECYKFILMQPASCCDIRLLQRNFLFNQSETLNVYGIHLPYNVANFVGINVGPISAIHWVSRNEYHPIFSYLPTMFNFADPSLNWGSFLLSLQICSGTPSIAIGEKDVFSAAWSRLPGLLMRRRFHEGAKQVVHLWQHILELWLDIMSIIVIIFHTYVGSGPKPL